MEFDLLRIGMVAGSLVVGAIGKKIFKRKPKVKRWVGYGTAVAAGAGGVAGEAAGLFDLAFFGEGSLQGLLAVGLHTLYKKAKRAKPKE
jgi:hypothetical protein